MTVISSMMPASLIRTIKPFPAIAKIIISIVLAIVVLASCSTSTDPATPIAPTEDREVAFSAYSARFADASTDAATRSSIAASYAARVTRATAGNLGLEDLRQAGFGVFAYSTGTSDYVPGTYTPNFMYNQLVADTARTGAWTYSPKKFWPSDGGKLSFFAYAPYESSTSSSASLSSSSSASLSSSSSASLPSSSPSVGYAAAMQQPLSFSPNTATSTPTVTYHLSEGGNNVDLLWGASSDGTPLTNRTLAYPNIDFYFRHALTKIGGMKQEADKTSGITIDLDADGSLNTSSSSSLNTSSSSSLNTSSSSSLNTGSSSGSISQGTKVTLSRVLIEQIGITPSSSQSSSSLSSSSQSSSSLSPSFQSSSSLSSSSQSSSSLSPSFPSVAYAAAVQQLTPSVFASGTLDLTTGTWTITDNDLVAIDTTHLSPYRQLIVPIDSFRALSAQATINSAIAEPAASKYISDATLGKRLLWDSIPAGITATPQSVYGYELMPLLVMPVSGYKPVLRLTVSYVVRTHDPWLLKGHSEMHETLTRIFTLSEEPLSAHRYHINIHLGLHSIRLDGNLEVWQVQHGSIIHDKTTQQNLQGPDIHEENPDPNGDNINWKAKRK